MTSIRVLAAHDVVRVTYPREPTERDEIGMATGLAIDGALAAMSHEAASGRRPTLAATRRVTEEILDRELADAHLPVESGARANLLAEVDGVLSAFRRSPLYGLPRPRSRLLVLEGPIGVYAQPDYWNRVDAFYEMKSYRPAQIPAPVELQVRIFQLAFPGFRPFLAWFDRHHRPVAAVLQEIPPPPRSIVELVIAQIRAAAEAVGQDRVLEYVDSPIIRYPPVEGPKPV